MRKSFAWKPFTSFFMFLSFVVLLLSGVVLYVAPPGRIANWTRWQLWLGKEQWQALHTVFATLFIAAAVLHLVFNWKVLLAYLKTRVHTGTSNRRELAVAVVTSLAVFALTLGDVPPFSTVMAIGEQAKNSWATPETEPPLPHAEGFTLVRLSEVTKQPVEDMLASLRQSGIGDATPESTVGALAAQHALTPQQVYVKLRLPAPPASLAVEQGLGRKSVAQVCQQLGLGQAEGLRRLEAAGIHASPGATMKELANEYGRTPHDLLPILRAN